MAEIGSITIPLFTRFGEQEHHVGELVIPVTFSLHEPVADAIVSANLHLDLGKVSGED